MTLDGITIIQNMTKLIAAHTARLWERPVQSTIQSRAQMDMQYSKNVLTGAKSLSCLSRIWKNALLGLA
jgi:hypothetical protein